MRTLSFLPALMAAALAGPAVSQVPDARPPAAVVVLTLDGARQGQIKHGRTLIEALRDERFGPVRLTEPTVPVDDFRRCEDDVAGRDLAFCARFYLHRSMRADSPPHVVVAFDDWRGASPPGRPRGAMRVLCFGRGATPSDAEAQDTWLWPDSARVHGVNAWNRDLEALAACVAAALAEPPAEPSPG